MKSTSCDTCLPDPLTLDEFPELAPYLTPIRKIIGIYVDDVLLRNEVQNIFNCYLMKLYYEIENHSEKKNISGHRVFSDDSPHVSHLFGTNTLFTTK